MRAAHGGGPRGVGELTGANSPLLLQNSTSSYSLSSEREARVVVVEKKGGTTSEASR